MNGNGIYLTPPELTIDLVKENSIAADLNISKGDRLVSINGVSPKDFIEFQYLLAEERISLHIKKKNGQEIIFDIDKDFDEDLGVLIQQESFCGIIKCQNKCLFCFVDQMPKGMRRSLYVKDDDYRFSFADGNFITLTNLTEVEFERILTMHLSPLYISVHTVDRRLRQWLMGNKRAGEIKKQLQRISSGGIAFHGQIVLVPGVNDGFYLEETIDYLVSLRPQARSVAVIPVGLTMHRTNLPRLRSFTKKEAKGIVAWAENWQMKLRKQTGVNFLYLADEFYLLAGEDIPQRHEYDNFPQLENGVGLLRLFYDELDGLHLPLYLPKPCTITLVTGALATGAVEELALCLRRVDGLQVKVMPIINHFFGKTVTVAGLVTGADIIKQLKEQKLGDYLFFPSVMLKDREERFLDDITLGQVSELLGLPVQVVSGPREIGHWLIQKSKEGKKND